MPLLDIVGATSTRNSFYAGFAFLQNEQETSYRFILDCLREVYKDADFLISAPYTIFVDKEPALINAIDELPFTEAILCLWHLN
jgi:MULE transposase domain